MSRFQEIKVNCGALCRDFQTAPCNRKFFRRLVRHTAGLVRALTRLPLAL